MSDINRPMIGVGIIIENSEGKILIGKRIGMVPKYSILGGHIELGDTFEQSAIREVKEEADLDIKNPKVIAITNNLETYKETGIHYMSVILLAKDFKGKPKIMEPHKFKDLFWCDPTNLPQPHFDASRLGVACYLEKVFYKDTH